MNTIQVNEKLKALIERINVLNKKTDRDEVPAYEIYAVLKIMIEINNGVKGWGNNDEGYIEIQKAMNLCYNRFLYLYCDKLDDVIYKKNKEDIYNHMNIFSIVIMLAGRSIRLHKPADLNIKLGRLLDDTIFVSYLMANTKPKAFNCVIEQLNRCKLNAQVSLFFMALTNKLLYAIYLIAPYLVKNYYAESNQKLALLGIT